MRALDVVRVTVAFVILLILNYTLRPLLSWWASPDFLVIALLLVAIRVRPGTAAIIGFVMGLVMDAVSLQSFGASALGMSLVGFVASWLKAVFFADDLWLNAFFFFLGKWAFDIVFLIANHKVGGMEFVREAVIRSPVAAAITAAAGLISILVLRPLLRVAPA
ncbi:MAG: rod shape-determining protein MreD [Gemmatimonadota bacterium]|nr:rod shape-determining protein MreD [Gemmatimonadota bacterium]